MPFLAHRQHPIILPPNRVWRSYLGGRTLDTLAGVATPSDGHFPEDWIASTTRAVNVGRESVVEGRSVVEVAGQAHDLATLLESDPEYFLGAAHVARHGARLPLLVKFLDSSIRLHFQVHPTAAFARQFLNSPSGKTEAYQVLAVRPKVTAPCVYLGFQRPPSRTELRRMIAEQDIAALESCFDPIPVAPGDTLLVPGGMPHALGPGLFLVELQEPTDLVVRFEFERGGFVLPEAARFMQRGLDFCLDVFDLTPRSREDVLRTQRCAPKAPVPLGPRSWLEERIGADRTPCFGADRLMLHDRIEWQPRGLELWIVTSGALRLRTGASERRIGRYEKVLLPAGLDPVMLEPESSAEILVCRPPA